MYEKEFARSIASMLIVVVALTLLAQERFEGRFLVMPPNVVLKNDYLSLSK
jgi:hypothetical protein